MLEPGRRTGRPLNLAWKLFLRVVDPETGRVRAECRGCGRNLVAQAHIDWCTKLAGTALMEDFQSNEAQLDAAVDAIDLLTPSSPTSSCSQSGRAESVLSVRSMASLETTPAKKSKQAVQTKLCVVKTDGATQSTINALLCKALVATNSSFTMTESDHVRELVAFLRPGVKLPCRKTLSGTLLDNLFNDEWGKMAKWVSGKVGSLSIDGWSGITREPVVGIALTVQGRTFLVKVVNTEGRPHTAGLQTPSLALPLPLSHFADALAEIALENIASLQDELNVRIVSLCSDNASNMKKMRRYTSLYFLPSFLTAILSRAWASPQSGWPLRNSSTSPSPPLQPSKGPSRPCG